MGIDNLADPRAEAKAARRNVRTLATSSPAGNTSVSEGAFEIRSTEGLIVSGSAKIGGSLSVTGTETVSGTLNVSGTETVSGTLVVTGTERVDGTLRIVGHLIVDGDQTVNGPLNVTGTFNISGASTLSGNLNVTGGGRITVGSMVLDPSALGSGAVGAITAPAAILLRANGVFASDQFTVTNDMFVNGAFHNISAPATTGSANAFLDSLGILKKITSASRYKIDVEEMDLPDAILDVRVKDWVDKSSKDRRSELDQMPRPFTHAQQDEYDGVSHQLEYRIPGVIAEDVEAAGGDAFVTYGADGRIEGVAYDRLALARTQVLADRVRELEATVQRLTELLEGH